MEILAFSEKCRFPDAVPKILQNIAGAQSAEEWT